MSVSGGWSVYLLECADRSLYCGITDDLDRRIKAHNDGKGAKYTRGRGPVNLVWSMTCADKSSALKEEARIKRLSRDEKLRLIQKS
jgi:putative endonuclease